ncbi:nitroreductase, partial [Mesorhizobium sp. M4B.F.Ca.ET.172.01.1.1]
MLEKNIRIASDAEIVDEAIMSRRSVRAFLPDMVDDDTIRAILA